MYRPLGYTRTVSEWTKDCFVWPTGHDYALSWLFRPLD